MNKHMRIVLGVLLVAVLVLGSFGLGSGAWFSSQVSSTNNSLTAATLNLTANDGNGTTQSYVVGNLKPGDWAYAGGQVTLKNTGSIPGNLWYEIVNVLPSNGPLGALVYPEFQENTAPWTRFNSGNVFNNAGGVPVNIGTLNPGDSIPMVLYVSWPSTPNDNAAQGASLSFDVIWHLDQIH